MSGTKGNKVEDEAGMSFTDSDNHQHDDNDSNNRTAATETVWQQHSNIAVASQAEEECGELGCRWCQRAQRSLQSRQ